MTLFDKLYNFNNYLLNDKKKYGFYEYLDKIYEQYISYIPPHFIIFYKQLFKLKHKFILDLSDINKFKILYSDKISYKNNKKKLKTVFTFFNEIQLKEHIDYYVELIIINKKDRLINIKLTPRAFKICLLYSNYNSIYINYLTILDQVKYHYSMYIILYNKKYNLLKKIDDLIINAKIELSNNYSIISLD